MEQYETQQDVYVFEGETLRDALGRVREVLGRDAIIVSQDAVADGYRVRATREMPQIAHPVSRQQAALKRARNAGHSETVSAVFMQRLKELEYSPEFAARLQGQITSTDALVNAIIDTLPLEYMPECVQGVYRFVGPAGGGKTTTMIKLAAQRVLRHGNGGVVLMTTNNRQLAGVETLALAAQLLNVPLIEVAPEKLNDAIKGYAHQSLILVDSASDLAETQPASATGLACRDVLTLPATFSAGAMRSVRGRFPRAGLLALTQTDMAPTLGVPFSLATGWGLPLWVLGTGSHLPDGLEHARRETLARLVLKGIDRFADTSTFA